MKKINSFILAAFTILSAASCQKEMMNPNDTEANGTPFSFEASRDIDTKTTLVKLEEGTTTYWTPGDKVSVFDKNGAEVEFKTAITENSASALFSCEMISLPEDLNIHAIYPNRGGVVTFKDGVITNLRVSGTQTAVAGSFDPLYAVAYAKGTITDFTTPPTLAFTNIHTLFKFTIGGEKAPAKVTLTNGGARCIVGRFDYNVETGDVTPWNDGKTATLVPAEGESFEIGQTYYIIIIGGGNLAKVSLKFDDTEVKYIEGPKYGDETNNKFLNRIINLGTVQFPVEEPKPETDPADLTAERLWVKTFAELGLSAGGARNCATDGEYVFVPNSAGSPVVVKAFPVNGGEAINVNMTGVEGGTHPTSCVRMIPNSDASINGGKDILLLTNLGISSTIYLYAYTNGIENAPERIPLLNTWRRQGDKFTVAGSWQEGELRFPDWNSGANAVVRFPIKNGAIATGQWSAAPSWDPSGKFNVTNGGISEFVTYPGSTSEALVTSTSIGTFNTSADGVTFTQSAWSSDPKLAMTFGYNFFTFNGKKYIAYARLDSNKTNGSLNIIEDKGSAAEFKSSLEVQNKFFTTAVLDSASSTQAGSSVCDCDIVEVDGKTYAAVLIDNCGLAYYEIKAAN